MLKCIHVAELAHVIPVHRKVLTVWNIFDGFHKSFRWWSWLSVDLEVQSSTCLLLTIHRLTLDTTRFVFFSRLVFLAKRHKWWGSPSHNPRIQTHSPDVLGKHHYPEEDESSELHDIQDHAPHPSQARCSSWAKCTTHGAVFHRPFQNSESTSLPVVVHYW